MELPKNNLQHGEAWYFKAVEYRDVNQLWLIKIQADYTMNQSELEPRKGREMLLSKARVLHLIGLQDSRRYFTKNRTIKE